MIDSSIGPLCVRLLPRLKVRVQSAEQQKILLLRPGGIGDAVLLIPAIQELRKRFPAASIHVLAEKRNAEVFLLCPDVERVFRYDRPSELLSVIRRSYDIAIDTEQWHRLSAVVARLLRAPVSVGFAANERAKLFTHPIPYSHDDYEVDSFLRLIVPLADKTAFDPLLPLLTVSEQVWSQIEADLRPLADKKLVVLFPGGSIAERQWGSSKFHVVAEQLSRKGFGIVVIGGKGDFSAGEEIVRGISGGLNMCGRLSLAGSAAVLKRSSLLITGDSGIMHVGYAVGAKVLALFGPGIEKKWAPRSPRVAILNKHLPCSPCTRFGYTPRCKKNTACMKEISVQEVVESAAALLEKS